MTTEYSDGDYLYGADLDNLVESTVNNGVLTGLGVTENTPTPDLNVIVAAGSGFAGETYFLKGSGTLIPITAAHGSLDRLDLIVVNSSGTISAVAGTPATTPNPPDLPDDSILLAIVEVDATVTQIFDADIIARGLFVGKIQNEHITDGEITNVKINAAAAIAWSKLNKAGSNLNDIATRSHTVLTDKGSNAHTAIDSHITTANAHIADTTSPHGTTMTIATKLTTPKVDNAGNLTLQSTTEHVYIRAEASGKNIHLIPSGKIYLEDDIVIGGHIQKADTNIDLQSTSAAYIALWIESSGLAGGVSPSQDEHGQCGIITTAAWARVVGEELYDDDGSLGEYSERDDLEDLRAIKPYLDKIGRKLKKTEHGDPVWNCKTLPPYIKSVEGLKHNKGTKKEGDGYINNSSFKGWMISLHQKHDERATSQEDELNLMKAEILGLKKQIKTIGG